jgi:hypothetical protein
MVGEMRIQKMLVCIILLATSCSPGTKQPSQVVMEPVKVTPTATVPQPTATAQPTDLPYRTIWLDPTLPEELVTKINLPDYLHESKSPGDADFQFAYVPQKQATITWYYALTAAFPTILDDVSQADLLLYWRTGKSEILEGIPIYIEQSTLKVFTSIWGEPYRNVVKVVPGETLLADSWGGMPSLALIPFEQLAPRWKVIRVDGFSPLDKGLDANLYPLVVHIGLQASPENFIWLDRKISEDKSVWLPDGNRDESKLTTLVMTGTTALTRATGAIMDQKGTLYPGKDIRKWLREADLLHISNEVSFSPDCPLADANQATLRFCSRPEYIELLQDVGVDVLELSGNHLHDWTMKAFLYSLDLYQQLGIAYYASGLNSQEAREPITMQHNGNRLAFIGCNQPGPDFVWATEYTPGVARCDYEWMKREIARLTGEGYLTIVTLQYYEIYKYAPAPQQRVDFLALADAGAVIVSGSQAHFPQGMEFSGDRFIHYGLGNLFFDQMDYPVKGTRQEFIDRHTFYDGRYINVELLTAMLEEYARPRPMTAEERRLLLENAFYASGW